MSRPPQTALLRKLEFMNRRVRMYATRWCADCRRAKRFLSERHVPVEDIDIERDEQ